MSTGLKGASRMELGWIYPRRKKLIEELISTPSKGKQGINFQGKYQYFDVYVVPLGFPKYRLNNGRTYAAQEEYLAMHPELPKDLFTRDPESDSAIKVQHELLKGLIKAKGISLLDYFDTHKQEDALVLTHEGFVLNGNRRLCAIRELYESDPGQYGHFSHIDIIILPPADEKDIDELEARLQIHKDIKDEYSWVTFALMLKRRQYYHHYSDTDLALIYEMKKGEITELIDMLDYAEEYLNQRGWPGEYHRVIDAFHAFQQIRKKRPKLKTEKDKELYEKISYALIDNPAGSGRLYDLIPAIVDYYDKIVEQIKSEFDVSDETKTEEDGEDLLGVKGTDAKDNGSLLKLFDDEKNRNYIREIVQDVVKGEKLKELERKRKNFVLNQIKKANSALTDALFGISEETSKTGIPEQINAIETALNKLKSWLNG